MEQNEILRRNKLIAEFDGWKEFKYAGQLYWHPERNITVFRKPEELEYHISWDWLMPVVEKIEKFARVDS